MVELVDYTGLENRHTARYRGFESLSFRFKLPSRLMAGHVVLVHSVEVRILWGQHIGK